MRLFRFAASVCVGALLAACAGPSLPTTPAPTTAANLTEGYRLEPGNRVRVLVFGETNLSGDFQVDGGGNISLPLVGNVPASGLTSAELSQRVEEVLKRDNFLREPRVSVEIQTFRPFYVLGEVRGPGEFPYSLGLTVLSAIARAGGYDYRAREGEVVLVRMIGTEQQEFRATERTPIQPGDIIRVLQRRI
jgi:protein involved in polysaccharide export with SLBB domain